MYLGYVCIVYIKQMNSVFRLESHPQLSLTIYKPKFQNLKSKAFLNASTSRDFALNLLVFHENTIWSCTPKN